MIENAKGGRRVVVDTINPLCCCSRRNCLTDVVSARFFECEGVVCGSRDEGLLSLRELKLAFLS
jgi:hypothetical protein